MFSLANYVLSDAHERHEMLHALYDYTPSLPTAQDKRRDAIMRQAMNMRIAALTKGDNHD